MLYAIIGLLLLNLFVTWRLVRHWYSMRSQINDLHTRMTRQRSKLDRA